jgi:predicted Zn-dependent protease
MSYLSFSRAFESEADMFGLEYMYKAGYDPTSFVDFFEKIETLEKRKPGTMSKVFSTHPMTDDRVPGNKDLRYLIEGWGKKAKYTSMYYYAYNLAEPIAPQPTRELHSPPAPPSAEWPC